MEGPQNFKGMRILVVEDEDDIAQLIRFNLEEEGFLVTISGNGLDALSKLERNLPDAIILDLMLPGMGGVEILKKIRAKFDVPVVLVTARAGETDAVLGLEMGADDYVRKPFSPRELVARVKAVFRRKGTLRETATGSIERGGIEMDLSAHRVRVHGKEADLTLIEFKLLQLLMENSDMAFTRDRLLDRVWGREIYVSDRAVDVNIKRLRSKLGEEKERLETVRGVGYRFRG
ncbi:MAG TPA: response regulator transcription factor [Leptospiraceae bacterium]|nr:response regulator transcription factor [Leptospiraceae bacterium]HMW60266.1 response regulator transcription factor [Leptospiraceae bacterium]HMX57045.1 response regulator transcription factor [Leptospiraceae bacterium]HMY45367.1 response regulator transcription factor [Leptospiraceae bacterium]HNE23759.1 response regulator transcription factor [Leptospiraceae bacterium]